MGIFLLFGWVIMLHVICEFGSYNQYVGIGIEMMFECVLAFYFYFQWRAVMVADFYFNIQYYIIFASCNHTTSGCMEEKQI